VGLNTSNFQRKGRAIAAHLPGWRYDAIQSDERRIKLIGPDRARLLLYFNEWEKRLKVSGEFVSLYHRNGPNAGMDYTRPSKALAEDIKRRVIADYLPQYTADRLLAEEQKEAAQRHKIFMDLVLKHAVGEAYGYRQSTTRCEFRNWYDKEATVQIHGEIAGEEVAWLKLVDLTAEQAFKIFAILKEK